MTMRKFRSGEDIPGPVARAPLDPENLRIAFGLSAVAGAFFPVRFSPGARKFRSWADLLQHRDEQIRELVTRTRS